MPEGRHGAAQLVCFRWGEICGDNGDLHRLFLKQGHAMGFFQHFAEFL